MSVLRRSVLVGACTSVLAGCVPTAPTPDKAEGVPGARRISYGASPAQFGELHLPAGHGSVPVVIVLHGGYWRAQFGLDLGTPLAVDLANHGVAAWNVEYRRLGSGSGGGGGWPATFDDVAAAVDAVAGPVQATADGRLTLSDVRAVGHSAGGQLAVWAAGRALLPAGAPGAAPTVRLSRVVSQAGVLDLVGACRQSLGGGASEELLGGSASAQPERYAQASPLTLLPLRIPVTCVHGAADATVPISQSETYVAAATAAGDPATLVRLPGVDHFALIDPTTPAWAACRDAVLAR